MMCIKFTGLHSLHDSLILELPGIQAAVSRLSVPMDLPVLDVSDKWNHNICGLCVWLLSLSIVFSRVACGIQCEFASVWVSNIPLAGPPFVYLSCDGHLSCFYSIQPL